MGSHLSFQALAYPPSSRPIPHVWKEEGGSPIWRRSPHERALRDGPGQWFSKPVPGPVTAAPPGNSSGMSCHPFP